MRVFVLKKWALCALILLIFSFATVSDALLPGSSGPVGSVESSEPVLLTVYIYDRCGGCSGSVETLGCGECKDTVTLHGIIKKQLGDRLYDGTIEYRLLNCRNSIHEEGCVRRGERYGVDEEWKYVRPVAYIGAEESGLYLPGENAMPLIKEMLDRYIQHENIALIQQDILVKID